MSAIDTLALPSTIDEELALTIGDAVLVIRENGLAIAAEAINALVAAGHDPAGQDMAPALIEFVTALLGAFAADLRSADAHAALARIDIDAAWIAADILLVANFGEGEGDISILGDNAILTLAGLVSASGRPADAVALLEGARADRGEPAFAYAAFLAARALDGRSADIADCWPAIDGTTPDVEAARELVAAAPLDPQAHRLLARALFDAGEATAALDALATAMVLPVADTEKLTLADDLAVAIAFLTAQGHDALIERDRLRWAIAGCPAVAAGALDGLATEPLAFLGEDALARAAAFLAPLAKPAAGVEGLAPLSPYPLRNGKPHVEIVWLEITNHCNQKCHFCPDMYRETPRTWLPLAQVKDLIDQMVETLSVGSMQLNAYGEPLLHPNIQEILEYIRAKQLPFPTFLTSHGMTLVPKKLKQLSHNYPAGIAISLHNDSQESYAATRSAKIGDYDTLVARVSDLVAQMVAERAPSHLRLYQMVHNANADWQVDPRVRAAFPDSPERMARHVRKWEAIAKRIAAAAPPEAQAQAIMNPMAAIERAFREATHADANHLPVLYWTDTNGQRQAVFMSARPVGTYANLLLEHHPDWSVKRQVVNSYTCAFTRAPSLAIFASGRLGICCLDMESTATFGAISDYPSLADALRSPEALAMFAQVSNGVATSTGCQICLGTGQQLCGSTK